MAELDRSNTSLVVRSHQYGSISAILRGFIGLGLFEVPTLNCFISYVLFCQSDSPCGRRIMVIISAFQADDGGSIPLARSIDIELHKKNTRVFNSCVF